MQPHVAESAKWMSSMTNSSTPPSAKRRAKAAKARREASGQYHRPIVTELAPASTFWLAEDYHQQYFEKQGRV